MTSNRKKWRPEKLDRQIGDSLERLKAFDRRTIEDLLRRNQETNEIDGYASNTAPGSGSRGSRMMLVKDERGDEVSVSIDSSTEAAAFRRIDGNHQIDPLGEAIDRICWIVEEIDKLSKEADRKRQVVLLAADGRRGRESSLQGNCTVCGDSVVGIGDDRLRRGLDSKCYVSWTRWKLINSPSDDPGQDFLRFTAWRKEQISESDWRIAEVDNLRSQNTLPPTGTAI